MTTAPVFDAKPEPAQAYKPLVLIVQSPYLNIAKTELERDAMLHRLNGTAHVRSLAIAALAWLYSPADVYFAGLGKDDAEKVFNPRIQTQKAFSMMVGRICAAGDMLLSDVHRAAARYAGVAEPPQIQMDELAQEALVINVLSPSQYAAEVISGGEYAFSAETLAKATNEASRKWAAILPKQGFTLGNFELDRLCDMLHVAAFYGADVRLVHTVEDLGLQLQTVEAKLNCDNALVRKLTRQADKSLYARMSDELPAGQRNAIVYMPFEHRMQPFKKHSPGLDVAFLNVRGRTGSVVEVEGILPYVEGRHDPNELKLEFTKLMGSAGLEALVELSIRPRQVAGA